MVKVRYLSGYSFEASNLRIFLRKTSSCSFLIVLVRVLESARDFGLNCIGFLDFLVALGRFLEIPVFWGPYLFIK